MVTRSLKSSGCDTIVIGAGPYGFAVAAHLKSRGVDIRVFGEPMSFWRSRMPKGMFLRSPWNATHIADPHGAFSLDGFLSTQNAVRPQLLPLEPFVAYGEWFQASALPEVDRRRVERVERVPGGFRVLADDVVVTAAHVVIATGLHNQDFRPPAFAGLPGALASHSRDHDSFEGFRGQRVAVIGRGQSAPVRRCCYARREPRLISSVAVRSIG